METPKFALEDRGPFSVKKEYCKPLHILNRKEMYQFYLKISKINEKKNFIPQKTLTSCFDVALNKRNAGQGMVVFMQRFDVSGFQKMVSETKCYLSTTVERLTYLSTLTSA